MPSKSERAKIIRALLLITLAGAAIFAFSPSFRNQFGSVKPATRRVQAADFAAQTLDGKPWALSGESGKVILVNFWATWCPPCRYETPALVRLHEKYASRGLVIAGITMDENLSAVPPFVMKYGIRYPVLTPQAQFPLMDEVEVFPTSFLIDRSGRVARKYTGMVTERGLTDDIEILLAEASPGGQ